MNLQLQSFIFLLLFIYNLYEAISKDSHGDEKWFGWRKCIFIVHVTLLCFTATQKHFHKRQTLMDYCRILNLTTAIISSQYFYFYFYSGWIDKLWFSPYADSVGLTIFHASQNSKSRISPTRKIMTIKAALPVFRTESKCLQTTKHCWYTLVMYDNIPLGLGSNGTLIRLYTQEICLSFSYSKLKWNGELHCTNK